MPTLSEQAKALGNARIRYTSEGRSGSLYFESDETTFDLWWEFGGGDALAIINIPTERTWVALTKLPLDKRDAILDYIAAQVINDQASGRGRCEISDDFLTIYKEKHL
jgi:hypothetical protein